MYRTARKKCLPFRRNVLTIWEQCAIFAEKCDCPPGKMRFPSTKICYTAQDKYADRPGKFYCHPGKICFSHKNNMCLPSRKNVKERCDFHPWQIFVPFRKNELTVLDQCAYRPGEMCTTMLVISKSFNTSWSTSIQQSTFTFYS